MSNVFVVKSGNDKTNKVEFFSSYFVLHAYNGHFYIIINNFNNKGHIVRLSTPALTHSRASNLSNFTVL